MSSDRAQALLADLMERVTSLRSSTEWLAAITAAARFHDYSFGNWVLLWSQGEARGISITRPAGFHTWRKLGRFVRRGEHGLQILAPLVRRVPDEEGEGEGVRQVVTGFRVVTVFDVSQTEGAPLPDASPRRLIGEDPTPLIRAAVEMLAGEGFDFTLERLRGPNGVTRIKARMVAVDERLEPLQRTKTTVHELAHVLMHVGNEPFECRGRVEVEAESVAFVVCAVAGLDTSAYSVPYVAGWLESTDDPARTLLATAETIVQTSRRILAQLDENPSFTAEPVHSESSHWTSMEVNDTIIDNKAEPAGAVVGGGSAP